MTVFTTHRAKKKKGVHNWPSLKDGQGQLTCTHTHTHILTGHDANDPWRGRRGRNNRTNRNWQPLIAFRFSLLFSPFLFTVFLPFFFIPPVCTASLSLRTARNGTTVHRSNRTRTRNVYPQSREARCRTLRAVFRSYCRRACNRSGAVVPRPCSRPDRSVPVPVCFNSSVPAW